MLSSRVQNTDRFKKLMGNILSTVYKPSNAKRFSLHQNYPSTNNLATFVCAKRNHYFYFIFLFFIAIIYIIKLFNYIFNFKVLTKAFYPVKETS